MIDKKYYRDFLIILLGVPLVVGICMVIVNTIANKFALDLIIAEVVYRIVGVIFTAPIAYHICKKYGISWKDEIISLSSKDVWVKAFPIFSILIVVNVIIDAVVDGVSITSKHLQIIDIYSKYADNIGIVGFFSEMLYYIGEGVWLASILYVGSKRWDYLGLIVLLLYWVPNHLWCRGTGIDILNFAFAGVLAFALEWCRRTVNNFIMVAFLFVLMVVI
jgi:hypothetical protein